MQCLARHGCLYGPSLEIINDFFLALSSGCAVNQAGDWDYCRMCSHECMRFHLIKVCTDNCYFLISTIWKETVLIRGSDWDMKRRETNVRFVVVYKSLLSGFMYLQSWKVFVSQNFDEVLLMGPVSSHLCFWENIHVCVPSSKLISHPCELKQCPALSTCARLMEDIYILYESNLLLAW